MGQSERKVCGCMCEGMHRSKNSAQISDGCKITPASKHKIEQTLGREGAHMKVGEEEQCQTT